MKYLLESKFYYYFVFKGKLQSAKPIFFSWSFLVRFDILVCLLGIHILHLEYGLELHLPKWNKSELS